MEVVYGGIYLYEPPKVSTSDQSAILVQSGSEQSGLRPFLIVSRDTVNEGKPTAVGVPLSTKTHKANSYRIFVPAGELIRDIGSAYEFRDSVALCDHIRVLDLTQIIRKIGRITDNGIVSVGNGIAFLFDLR